MVKIFTLSHGRLTMYLLRWLAVVNISMVNENSTVIDDWTVMVKIIRHLLVLESLTTATIYLIYCGMLRLLCVLSVWHIIIELVIISCWLYTSQSGIASRLNRTTVLGFADQIFRGSIIPLSNIISLRCIIAVHLQSKCSDVSVWELRSRHVSLLSLLSFFRWYLTGEVSSEKAGSRTEVLSICPEQITAFLTGRLYRAFGSQESN